LTADFGESPRPNPPLPGPEPGITGEGIEGVSFAIDPAATSVPETARREPALGAVPAQAEPDEPGRLDPERAQEEPPQPAPPRRRPGLPIAMLGSLGVHLLPLLVLLNWSSAPAEVTPPIPVQLVLEQPPPPPPPAPETKKRPPGRLASEDIGDITPKPHEAAGAPAPDQPAPEPPAETQLAAIAPPPKPAPTTEPASVPDEPKPAPPTEPPVKQAAAVAPPKPLRPPKPAVPAFEWHRLDTPPQAARVPGPAATRDEYLAYCMTLIRRHFGTLSPAFLAGRRGAAVFRLVVRDDGTIARVTVAESSPYPDIDERIEEAVNAVGRFPPLPQWLQGTSAGLILQVTYPDGLWPP
jgi:periplasmic protein TonB